MRVSKLKYNPVTLRGRKCPLTERRYLFSDELWEPPKKPAPVKVLVRNGVPS